MYHLDQVFEEGERFCPRIRLSHCLFSIKNGGFVASEKGTKIDRERVAVSGKLRLNQNERKTPVLDLTGFLEQVQRNLRATELALNT